MTSDRLIILKLADGETLSVAREILTSASPKFQELIDDLHQSELEMDDFGADAVYLFVTSLFCDSLQGLEPDNFRDLHKMGEVFGVNWIAEDCRTWLRVEIESLTSELYPKLQSLLRESLYLKKRWGISRYLNFLVDKSREISCAVPLLMEYRDNFGTLTKMEIKVMLQLAGSDTEIIINMVNQNLQTNRVFGPNHRYLLENINGVFFMQQDHRLCLQLFEILSSLECLTKEDLKFVLRFQTSLVQEYLACKEVDSSKSNAAVQLYRTIAKADLRSCTSSSWIASDISIIIGHALTLAATQPEALKLYMMVDYLLNAATYQPNLLQYPSALVESLQKAVRGSWKRINTCYIDKQFENDRNKGFLRLLAESASLTSYCDSTELHCDLPQSSSYNLIGLKTKTIPNVSLEEVVSSRLMFPFRFKHPAIKDCKEKGDCGFMVQLHPGRSTKSHYSYSLQLCTDNTKYPPELHYHTFLYDIVGILVCETESGRLFTIGAWTGAFLEAGIFSNIKNIKVKKMIVYCDVSKSLVAKQSDIEESIDEESGPKKNPE